MSWQREGQRIQAQYLGTFPISGVVELSRVSYGGKVQHTIKLDNIINCFGADRDCVIMSEQELVSPY